MKLAKLTIESEGSPQPSPIKVLFNPNSITLTKSGWLSSENGLIAKEAADMSLSVELFFDTSLPSATQSTSIRQAANAIAGRTSLLPKLSGRPKDVREYTNAITSLTQPKSGISKSGALRPPVCKLYWGKQEAFFQGVLKSVTQTLTRFSEDGTALRATLSCDFEAWEEPELIKKAQNPIDDPIRIVKRGETLSSIAAEEYGDPSLWRIIAAENRLVNPRLIRPGDVLTVPPLRADATEPRR
ncbi:MAG: peptidoglycan-binding LysM [Phormidesmis priestleyi]|uniref:Peptidoglycan-binding LysM n=1 Tax=Phormidesmis priestleyi TaxID=268141 RepID=A0A2W4X9F6_9CYAN|nr:MAG: peptidoglycan-binding LysM [Phormidesmis priestleyi]